MKKYIAIEGVNGSGKTTIVNQLKEQYAGQSICFVKEPQDYLEGEKRVFNMDIANQTAILAHSFNFYMNDQNIKNCDVVITDRFWISSMCYFPSQPARLRYKFMSLCNSLMSIVLKPCGEDVAVFILEASKQTILKRVEVNRCPEDFFFENYKNIKNIFGQNYHINAEQPSKIVLSNMMDILEGFELKGKR